MKQTIRFITSSLGSWSCYLRRVQNVLEDTAKIEVVETLLQPQLVSTNLNTNSALSSGIDFTVAAENTVNAVVHVKYHHQHTANKYDGLVLEGTPRAMIGTGSGVIISPDGYIITNNHVIENASELEVTLNNNKIYKAELIGSDPKTDIALIKVESEDQLPFIPLPIPIR